MNCLIYFLYWLSKVKQCWVRTGRAISLTFQYLTTLVRLSCIISLNTFEFVGSLGQFENNMRWVSIYNEPTISSLVTRLFTVKSFEPSLSLFVRKFILHSNFLNITLSFSYYFEVYLRKSCFYSSARPETHRVNNKFFRFFACFRWRVISVLDCLSNDQKFSNTSSCH